MELKGIMLSELSQTQKGILYDLSYTSNLKKQKQKTHQGHRYREQIGGCQRQGVGGGMGEMGEWCQKTLK